MSMPDTTVILTGDRPTGPLHLGHYVGSLRNRVRLQEQYLQYVMIADVQALTDNYDTPEKVRSNMFEVMLDYLAVGIDPEKTTIFVQSSIPEIAELTVYYLNFVTVNRLKRNPTVKAEIQQAGFGDQVPVGFLAYPVSQAADITVVRANCIPVGEDQLPMIEQTNEIIRTFHKIYDKQVFPEVSALVPQVSRLPGIDGRAKMGKSLGNAIYLSDSAEEVACKVHKMYTDPHHVRVQDPGRVEGNVVFDYLDAFAQDQEKVQEMKEHYQKGGLGDVTIKRHLTGVLEEMLAPIRERRKAWQQKPQEVMSLLHEGTKATQKEAQKTMQEVRQAMSLNYFTS